MEQSKDLEQLFDEFERLELILKKYKKFYGKLIDFTIRNHVRTLREKVILKQAALFESMLLSEGL